MAREETASLTIRLPKRDLERLDELAKSTRRSKAFLAARLVSDHLEYEAWKIKAIQEALDEIESGAPLIEHERVVEWVKSWDTENELPPPE